MKKIVVLLFAVGLLLVAAAGAQDEPLFRVIPNNNLNLRACASTECDRVGQVPGGTELPVYAVEGDWYQVQVDGELVWVAGWLTTRAPDKVLEPDEIYRDSNTGCEVLLDGEGYDGDLNIVLSGDRWNDVEVKIFRPGASSPLRVSDRFNDVFEDTGDPFIWQYYSVNSPWRAGLYRLEITLDGRTSLLAWRLERAGDQVIYVFCDGPVPRPTRTPRPTATRRPGPTSRPSITPRPTRTPRPTVTAPVEHTEIRTGALYRDEATGCEVLVLEFPPEQEDWKDLWVVRDGELRHDVRVDIWLPDAASPLHVEDEIDDTWDSGEPLVSQSYSLRTDWRNGLYRIEVSLGDATTMLTWRMERAAYYRIRVSCYQPVGPAPSV